MTRIPNWTREEMILAADLARTGNWKGVNSKNPGVIELSYLLRNANIHQFSEKPANFRSVNSVNMKVNNFVAGHPNHTGTGLRTSAAELVILEEFIDAPKQMAKIASDIRMKLQPTKENL